MASEREPEGQDHTRRQGGSVPLALSAFDVVVVEGTDIGARASLDAANGSSKLLVGTGPLCELRLGDPTVAQIVLAYLVPGVRLRVGSTILEVRSGSSEPAKVRRAASLGRMASASPRMMNVLSLCERLAPTDVAIVLEGETGTGKERLAECIHEASARAQQPFIVLDCRTTPRGMAETHLFGELRADGTSRAGIFELASGGTLLVDEPGDLDLDIQAKLLRALDKGTIVRVGDTSPTPVDARIIVATSQNLDRLVEARKFREDLYHRLAGARIELPPLRRRREDIPLVAGEIWTEIGGRGLLPDEVLERYEGYDWPGNVRELERAVERFLALGDKVSLLAGRTFRHSAPPEPPTSGGSPDVLARILAQDLGYSEARQRMLEEFEQAYLEKALADSGGNVAAAAARSGIARRHFQRIRARNR
jgi:DNA-binding NtrC family response regulator